MKENSEKKIRDDAQISKLTNAPPKDTAAFESNRVFAKVSSVGSGTQKPSPGHTPPEGEDSEWKDAQKNEMNKSASEIIKRKNTMNKTISKISYFL